MGEYQGRLLRFWHVNGVPGPALRSGNRTGLVEESPSLVLGVLS